MRKLIEKGELQEHGQGFSVTFPNKNVVSVQWKDGNYCTERWKGGNDHTVDEYIDGEATTDGGKAATVEVAAWVDGGDWYSLTAGDDAMGWVTRDSVMAILQQAEWGTLKSVATWDE